MNYWQYCRVLAATKSVRCDLLKLILICPVESWTLIGSEGLFQGNTEHGTPLPILSLFLTHVINWSSFIPPTILLPHQVNAMLGPFAITRQDKKWYRSGALFQYQTFSLSLFSDRFPSCHPEEARQYFRKFRIEVVYCPCLTFCYCFLSLV